MNLNNTSIKRALISVSNKKGIVDFARELHALNIEIISTGGTSQLLRENHIPVRDVSDVTKFPEMMDGRVKTLHPLVHGGILGLRDEHAKIASEHHIEWIDLVVVNLYPFAATIKKPNVTMDEAIENIDIGGPTMIRSAAKNMGWVSVVVDPSDYALVIEELKSTKALTFTTRKHLAIKAFGHTADYDAVISGYLQNQTSTDSFPQQLNIHLEKYLPLRYGENPHQAAAAYRFSQEQGGILSAKQHQGKELSYNNIADADAALACVREFAEPACAIIKHANPCGVAVSDTIADAFHQAFQADNLSAFGGVVALNRTCDNAAAEAIATIFIEVLLAPSYTIEALEVLAQKKNLRVLECDFSALENAKHEFKYISGGFLIQDKDSSQLDPEKLKVVTKKKPTSEQLKTMRFAWPVLKHIKSNAVLLAKHNVTVGVGAGQVSRVDAVDIAIKKADGQLKGSVMASDAFFPFRDSIDRLANTGITAIIQPGGSVRDEEVIAACDEHGIAMVFTGVRCFKH